MSTVKFNFVYDGPALQGNEMSARELSSALIAADELFRHADKVLNEGRSTSRLAVKASFQTGCFGIEFVSSVTIIEQLKGVKDLFTGDSATAILNAKEIFGLIFLGSGSLFKLLKWLRGRVPTKIEQSGGKWWFCVSKDRLEVEYEVIKLYKDHATRAALEGVVKPMESEGIDCFAVEHERSIVADANRSEVEYFSAALFKPEDLGDTTRDAWLNIIAPAFKDGDKWRVSEGGSSFYALLADDEFRGRVLRNEVEFGAATMLKVCLTESQYTDERGGLHKESRIIRVLEVRKPELRVQMDLLQGSEDKENPPK